ncbi:hypothetical protein LEP1GSC195_3880 [Leptospira wolbachii serovar Codice str. CDC]|uniref:Uncharacterized protein n=2 Tax=Leptospira TaxID=171 RepID=R9A3E5_9LEPT|nr:hypothetical protein LEP1GSC195_3880 [Leptospira wolbachii serovar Codice str. CDC]
MLLMPWEYGDNISVSATGTTDFGSVFGIQTKEDIDVWNTENPVAKGYLINWLLFTPGEDEDYSQELTLADLKTAEPLPIDASNPIPLPHSPSETLELRNRIHEVNKTKELLTQKIEQPGVYHARIFISSSIELQYLKELIIPYSAFPYFEVEGMNYKPSNQELVGYIDWSAYKDGGFVYVILSGYHYNFLLMNDLFQAIEILKPIDYEELALLDFDLSMSPEQFQVYSDQLQLEANEWKIRDNQAYLKLQKLRDPAENYQFAIFGFLRGGLSRIFSNVWNHVRIGIIKANVQLTNRLKFDLNRLTIPDELRNRMKIKPSEFFNNAFTPPKWIRDRLKLPKWLRDKLKLSSYKPLRGIIEVLDANGKVFQFKRQDRKMTLDWTPIEFRVGPQLPGELQDFNPFDLLTEKSTTLMNGIFNKNLQATVPILGTPISYNICYNLDNGYSRITNNGIFPLTICAGQFKPREFPYYIQIKNSFSQTAAMIQFAHAEALQKLGVLTKRANVFQGGGMNPATWKGGGDDSIGAFAPCGQIINLVDTQKVALYDPGILSISSHFLSFDIYLERYENFLTVVHEYSHIVHCSLIGESKYREQIAKYAEDVIQGFEPRKSEYGKLHEGIANYIEFLLNANMSYCPTYGCKNIEENHHSGYLDFSSNTLLLGLLLGTDRPYTDFDIFNGADSKEYRNSSLPFIKENYFDNNQIMAISSFLYDLEDSCEDNFRKIISNTNAGNVSNERFYDRVHMGRSNVVSMIRHLPYPAKLQNLSPMVFAMGVTPDDYWELVDLHGLNGLTKGLPIINPFDSISFGTFTIDKANEKVSNNCLAKAPSIIQYDIDLASNIIGMNQQPNYRKEQTPILELDKSISIESLKSQHVPSNAFAITWKKENQAANSPNLDYIKVEDGIYQTSKLSWTSNYGIDWPEFLQEATPLYSTAINWYPLGKEIKDMGVIEYSRIDYFTSPAIEYYWFTENLPEYTSQNESFGDFISRITPEGCQGTTWSPIGKPNRSMGTECWTGVGVWAGIPYTEDYCSGLIDYDDRHTVVKSPISINIHFVHYYDLRTGQLSCDHHSKTSSGLFEFDDRSSYIFPPRYYNDIWKHLYDQKDGHIRFSNPHSINDFITRSGLNYAHLSTQKEKGYFEYYVENK